MVRDRLGRDLSYTSLVVAVMLAAGAGLTGCAGRQQQRISRNYLEAGEYDRAVEAAQQAAAKSPGDSGALDLLSDAQTAAADHHAEQARKRLTAHRPAEAMAEIDKALGYMPAHPGANSLKIKAGKVITQCKGLVDKAREAAARQEWQEAVLAADEACRLDEGDSQAHELFDQARSSLVNRYLAQARAALDAGDAKACLDGCAKAARWDNSNLLIADLQKRAKESAERATVAASPSPNAPAQTRPAAMTSVQPTASAEPALAVVARAPSTTQPVVEEPLVTIETISPTERAHTPAGDATHAATPAHRRGSPTAMSTEGAPASEVHGASAGRADLIEITTPAADSVQDRSAEHRSVSGRIVDASAMPADVDARPERPSRTAPARMPAPPDATARQTGHLFVGAVSRHDHQFKKMIAVVDGITVKVSSTGKKPLDADLEIVAGRFKIKPKDVPVGATVEIQGISGRRYNLTVLWIDHKQHTVKFAIDRLD